MQQRYTLSAMLMACTMLEAAAQCITAYPSTQSFGDNTTTSMPAGWSNLTMDDLDWLLDRNGTPTEATGPIGDRTSNSTKGNYLYVEASGAGAPSKVAVVQTPCYNLSGLSQPYLTFWYHMQGAQMGSLRVDVNVGGTITQNAWSVSGDQGGYWRQGWVDLAPFAGQSSVQFRFRAVTGGGELSDIALDDVRVTSLNPVPGCMDATAANYMPTANLATAGCDYSCPVGQRRVRIDIVNDNYPNETSWTLRNSATNAVVASGGSQGTTLCVPANTCLVFRINDSAGDGIYHATYGYGAYMLWMDGALVHAGGAFGSYEETTFGCAAGQACTTAEDLSLAPIGTLPSTLVTMTANTLEHWYDFTVPATGSYTVTTCGLNSCDTRLWMYDMACNTLVLNDDVEGATFADDNDGGCGQQAVITGNMPAGEVYHIRVGTAGSSCASATFRIIYNGPVVGCMTPGSCNYDPLATVPCNNCCFLAGSPECPEGPDLTVDEPYMINSLTLGTRNVQASEVCMVEEGCVRGFGQRYIIRFATKINNIGELDYHIGQATQSSPMFNYENCHGHAHYEGYADYVLFDQEGSAVPVGFKNGFCVMDVGCTPGHSSQYGCSTMGITAGCYDIYGSGTTCNWMDITDVPAGLYTMVVRTNWMRRPDALGRHETDYSNNFAKACIQITRNASNVPSFAVVSGCVPVVDCMGQSFGSSKPDCLGACNGTAKGGDLDNNGAQDQLDALDYVVGILGNDIPVSACNDLNADGRISVADAGLMVWCYRQQEAHDDVEHVLHYHPWCEFPRGYVSTVDTVDLRVSEVNTTLGYVDIEVRNPSAWVRGLEFILGGLQVETVENLNPQVQGELLWTSSLGGTKVVGLSYLDSTLAKNQDFVPLVRVHYLALTGPVVNITSIVDVARYDGNGVITRVIGEGVNTGALVTVSPRVLLEGPYQGDGLMHDGLRTLGVIPTTEPYSAMGYYAMPGAGGETVAPSVLAVTGNNAIVDWVLVELRSSAAPHAVVAARCALLQRDGDVVGTDGFSPVALAAGAGQYRVAVRHRNHMGAMTNAAVSLGGATPLVDLSVPATGTWGQQARKSVNDRSVLWAGNSRVDEWLKYTGQDNDRDRILSAVGGSTPTHIHAGYLVEDVSMDGVIRYMGSGNDRDIILVNLGGSSPTVTREEQLP